MNTYENVAIKAVLKCCNNINSIKINYLTLYKKGDNMEKISKDNPCVIAMDIDDFITTMEIKQICENGELDPVHLRKELFINVKFKHRDTDYEVANLLTPGCIEFLRFLFEKEYIRPAFFSAGIRTRNLDLGKQIVELLINSGGDPEWINRYDIYSQEDCLDTDRSHPSSDRDFFRKFQPKNFFGNYKKDLRVIYYGRETYHKMVKKMLQDHDTLAPDPEKDSKLLQNIILVEEDSSYLLQGQEKNMLLCPTHNHPYPFPVNYQKEDTPVDPENTFNVFKSANTIFYAAGILNQTFKRYFSEDKSILEILWEEQGPFWFEGKYDDRFPVSFFTQGREVLRKYNPKLNFAVAGSPLKSE